jgi:hypothetical protein
VNGLLASSLAVAGSLIAACEAPAAIINKLLANRGRDTFATPADMARAVFDGSSKVDVAFQIIAALVLLGAIAATVGGVWRIARGADGGFELAASGIFGVLGLMAAMTVVM